MSKQKGLFLPAGLICLALCFIWGNSMLSGEESGAVSGGLLSWMTENFPVMSWLPERLLRKFGHFSEFALLGFLLGWFFLRQGQRGLHRFTVPLLFGMTAALTDETIQSFSPGRSPQVTDVWIDTAGVCAGIIVFLVLHTLVKQIMKTERNQT